MHRELSVGSRVSSECVGVSVYLEEDSQRGEDDGKDELEDIGTGESHGECVLELCVWNWLREEMEKRKLVSSFYSNR
jgi:hypothetical protein